MPDETLPTWDEVGPELQRQFPTMQPAALRQQFEQRRAMRLVQQATGPIDMPTWEEAGPALREQFPQMDQHVLQQQFESRRLQLHAQRQAEHEDEDWFTYIRRRVLPGASTLYNFAMNKLEGEARDRIRRGVPSADVRETSPFLAGFGIDLPQMTDYQLVATQERLRQIEEHRTTPEAIASGVAHLPSLLGEAAAGGAVLRGVGATVPGLGFLARGTAPAVATEAPPLLSSAGMRAFGGEAAANAWRGLTSAGAWGRTAAQATLTPSMYLPEAARRAADRPEASQWYEIRNLGPAWGLGFAQTAILGSLGGVANNIPGTQVGDYLRRAALRTGTGMAEQQIIDILAGATGLQTGYGIGGDILQGKWGDALKHSFVQAATFAAFAGIHEATHGPPLSGAKLRAEGSIEQIGGFDAVQARTVMQRYQQTLDRMRRQGMSHEAAGNQLNAAFDAFINELKINPYMNRGDARELAGKVQGSDAVKDFAKFLGEQFPQRAPQQLPAQGPQPGIEPVIPPQQHAAQGPYPGLEGLPPGVEGTPPPPELANRAAGPFTAPGMRETISPTQMPAGEMVNLRKPQVREPFAIFTDAEVRGIAKEAGISIKGTRQEIIERIRAVRGDHGAQQLEEKHMPAKIASMSAEELNQARMKGLWYGAPQVFGTPKQPIAPHERPGMPSGPMMGLGASWGKPPGPPEPPTGGTPARPTPPKKPGPAVPTAPEVPHRTMKELKDLFESGAPAEKVMQEAGMDARERFVVGKLLRGATLEEVAAEPKLAKKDGTKLNRERIRQIAAEGLDKIGATSEAIKQVLAEEKTGVVQAGEAAKAAVEKGKAGALGLATVEGEGGKGVLEAPITGEGKKSKRQMAEELDAKLEKAADDYIKAKQAAGGKLDPKTEKMFNDEFIRLNDERALYRQAGEPLPTAEALMSQGGAKEGGPGQFEMIAAQNKAFGGNPEYVEKNLRGQVPAKAMALLHEGAIITQKMAAGDPVVNLEENFHIWSVKNGFEANPQAMPPDVAEGLRQFYHPQAPLDPRTMLEGAAQWFLKRTLGRPTDLTPQQAAASRYAENFLKEKGFTAEADKLKEMYAGFKEKSPIAQAAGLLSATGKPVEQEQRSFWQRVGDAWKDNVTDNLNVLERAGMDRARLVYGRLMYADHQTAEEFARSGVWTIRDGKKTFVGPSQKKISESLLPEDMAPIGGEHLKWFEKGVSKAEVYAVARHVLNENLRDRAYETVSPEQLKYFERAMAEFQQDPAFMKRAEAFAYQLSAGYNATLRALGSPDIHFISQKKVDAMISDKPDFISLARVKENEGSKTGFLKGRTGSGEQIISPLTSYNKRLQVTAALMNEQIRRNSVADAILTQPNMGKWALAMKAEMTKEGEARVAELAKKLNIPDGDVIEMLGELGPHAASYFDVQPWSSDATKNTWSWRGPDGELTNFRIKDRALYDLISGIQGDANPVAQAFRWMGKIGFDTPFGRVQPVSAATGAIRALATGASLAFNVKNALWPMRDPLTYLANTIDRASIAELPDMLKRVYSAEVAAARGEVPQDVLLNLYLRERGREQHMFSAESNLPEFVTSKADVIRKILNVMGAGELGPRALEFKNKLKERGWTEERLIEETKKAEEAAKQGKEYQDPVPWDVLQDAMNAANEVTVPFDRQGIVTREVSKIVPFFGPSVAGTSKFIRNWKTNAAGASFALGGYLALRLLHWGMYHNEDWYQQLSPYDRFRNFIVPIPGLGLRRLPGPLGAEVAPGAVLTTVLDAAARNNPDFAGALEQTLSATLPPGVERVATSALQGDVVGMEANAAGTVLGPGQTAVDVARNRNFMNTPIVPKREEHLPASQQFTQYQGPYIAQQALGGRFPASVDQEGIVRALGVQPFPEVQNLRRSVNDVFEQLHSLEGARTVARRAGTRFDQERQYQVLSQAASQIRQISQRLQGMTPSGRQGEKPSEEEARRLRQRQTEIARAALERLR